MSYQAMSAIYSHFGCQQDCHSEADMDADVALKVYVMYIYTYAMYGICYVCYVCIYLWKIE